MVACVAKKEDFVCEHCGATVKGSGYTNHCPQCFYSKHVDIDPGDRLNTCKGLMEPIGMEIKGKTWRVRQRCLKCGEIWENKLADNDDITMLIELVKMRNK